jgi:hypothetical protein
MPTEKVKIINPFTDIEALLRTDQTFQDQLDQGLNNISGLNVGALNDFFSIGKDGIRFANLIWVSGTITTTDENPVTSALATLAVGKSTFIVVRLNAQESGGKHGSFERRALVKNTASVIDYFQIQDAFTVMDDDWKVDFEKRVNKVRLRVWGKVAQTITWKYNGMILTSA